MVGSPLEFIFPLRVTVVPLVVAEPVETVGDAINEKDCVDP